MTAYSLETLLVHAGRSQTLPRSTVPPIYASTSYQPETPEALDAILGGTSPGYSYARHANPTADALAQAVAVLEGGDVGVAFGSGMAAIDAALFAAELRPGDRLLLSRDLYGASINLAQTLWGDMGVQVAVEDLGDPAAAAAAIARLQPRAVLLEVLTNPVLKVIDVPAVAAAAHAAGAQVIVDNTFTTPLLCRPLGWDVDLVVHSATKYLGGHGDATGGVVVGRARHAERLKRYMKLRGAALSPFDAWLIHRGLRTLALRFGRQLANARSLASRLSADPHVSRVFYPLLEPEGRERADRLLGGEGGAVVTIELPGGRPAVFRFLKALKLAASATTVGDVYTLCLYPAIASHRNQTPAEWAAMGITEGTVRIAAGIEHPDDLYADLSQAARAAAAGEQVENA